MKIKRVGIFVHGRWKAASELAGRVREFLSGRVEEVWQTADWEDKETAQQVARSDLIICLGGDGSMLWAARTVIPYPVPILGVNMGRLGFLAELTPDELWLRLPDMLEGRCRIEERAMLQADVPSWGATWHALNDVVVGRGSPGRPVYIGAMIDGRRIALYRCDAVIVASATGSTAYSLSAGGPIIHPESKDLLLTPVAPHLAAARPLVLPYSTVVELVANADGEGVLSVDGLVDRPLKSGESVSIRLSPHSARFVRFNGPERYYSMLAERLDWLRVINASIYPELLNFGNDKAK